MQIFSANDFEDYESYSYKKEMKQKNKTTKRKRKSTRKTKGNNIKEYNEKMNKLSSQYADNMKNAPSELEKKMLNFLDSYDAVYEFQKVFNIKKKNKKIKRFYIADFFIPSKNLIIETDGAFHDQQIEEDEYRTKEIQEYYPDVKVLRWKWKDFYSYNKMKELLHAVL